MGQRSKATIDQRREQYFLQFRTSCRSRLIRHFWKPSVFYIAITGLFEMREAEQAPKELVQPASNSSSSSVLERSDELATRTLVPSPENQNQKKQRDDKKNSKDPLSDLPHWSEDFKENLKDTDLHASAHSSPESDPEHPTKGQRNQGSTVSILTSKKTETATSA